MPAALSVAERLEALEKSGQVLEEIADRLARLEALAGVAEAEAEVGRMAEKPRGRRRVKTAD